MRAVLATLLLASACRGIDECSGEGSAMLEVGRSLGDEFEPYGNDQELDVLYDDAGLGGVELALRSSGLNTYDAVTVTLEVEVEGYLRELVSDTELVCDNAGNGRVRVFGGLPQSIQRDLEAYAGSAVYLAATVIDDRDRAVDADPLIMRLALP